MHIGIPGDEIADIMFQSFKDLTAQYPYKGGEDPIEAMTYHMRHTFAAVAAAIHENNQRIEEQLSQLVEIDGDD